MNFKTTLGLLILLVVVGLVVWLSPSTPEPTTEPETPETESGYVLADRPERDDIQRVIVERADEPRMVLKRVESADDSPLGGKWQMLEPVAGPAEEVQIRTLVSAFLNLQFRTKFTAGTTDEISTSDAGLDPPAATITLIDQNDKQYIVHVGNKVVMSADTYVSLSDDDQVYVAKRDLPQVVDKDIDEYRAKRLTQFTVGDAKALQIGFEGQSYDLTRGDGDEWVINAPLRAYAERERVDTLLNRFNGLRVAEFVDDAPADLVRYGLDTPYLTVSVTTETERELPVEETTETQPAEPEIEIITQAYELLVGNTVGLGGEERYARVGDQDYVVSVKQTDVDNLVPKLDDLRDPRITRVKTTDAQQIALRVGDTTATIEKVGGQWRGTGDLAQLEAAAVTDVLQAFEDLQAVSYIDAPDDPAKYGLAPPRVELSVTAAGSVNPVTLLVGNPTPSGRNAYVQRAGEQTVIVTSAAQADRLVVDPLALRSREIFSLNAADIQQISIERGERHYELSRADGSWSFITPADAPVAADRIRNLTNDLARLRATVVVSNDKPDRFGLGAPAAIIQFTAVEPAPAPTTQEAAPPPAQPIAHELRVGLVDNVAYAQANDDPHVFELDGTVKRTLLAELIEPRLFDFGADDLSKITITAPDVELELGRGDEGMWAYPPEPYLALDEAEVQDLLNQLVQTQVQSYIAYDAADLSAADLSDAPARITLLLADGREIELRVGPERREETTRIAGIVDPPRVFELSDEDADQLLRGLGEFVADDE